MFSKSVLAAVLSALIASSAAAPLSLSRRDVIVKSGDTCNTIAAATGTTAAEIMASNPSVNSGCTNLQIGQVLKIDGGVSASPVVAPDNGVGPDVPPAPPASGDITPEVVLAAAPASKACAPGAPASCKTAEQAAPLINAAFSQFGINSKGEKAALLSLMAFETGDFLFDTNQFPGRAGQGTRNMMLFNFILKYALETPSVAPQVAVIAPGLTADSPAAVVDATPADTMNAIRALVLEDSISFASAAWFLKTKCEPEFATNLQSGTQAAYETYLTGCIGTTVTPERINGFNLAINAMA
jgi:murein DD-endopeptidase MepM/ murein hydrolase activator NlpD